jgi:hypothetical protein
MSYLSRGMNGLIWGMINEQLAIPPIHWPGTVDP